MAEVRATWAEAGRFVRRGDPAFMEAVGEVHQEISERERTVGEQADPPKVTEIIAVNQSEEDGRCVCRAVALWSDGTMGEAVAWWPDALTFEKDEMLGRTGKELDLTLFLRS